MNKTKASLRKQAQINAKKVNQQALHQAYNHYQKKKSVKLDSLLSKSFDYSFSSSFINDEEEEIIEPKEPSEIDEPIDEWEPRVPMEPKQDKEPIIDQQFYSKKDQSNKGDHLILDSLADIPKIIISQQDSSGDMEQISQQEQNKFIQTEDQISEESQDDSIDKKLYQQEDVQDPELQNIVIDQNNLELTVVQSESYYNRQMKWIKKFQMVCSVIQLKKQFNVSLEKYRIRRQLLKELVQKQESIVSHLDFLIEKVYKPLKEKEIFNKMRLQTVFSNIDLIHVGNKNFLKDLQQLQRSFWPYQKTTEIFLDYHDSLQNYRVYFSDYKKAMQYLVQIKQDTKKAKYLVNIFTVDEQQMDLAKYIIMPINMIEHYLIFLNEFLSCTEQDHPDYRNIGKVLENILSCKKVYDYEQDPYFQKIKMKEIDEILNGQVQLWESQRQLKEIESCYFLEDEQLSLISLYIFSDLIIVSQRKKSEYKQEYLKHVKLNETTICKNLGSYNMIDYILSIRSNDQVIDIKCNSAEQKNRIFTSISEVLGQLRINQLQNEMVNHQVLVSVIGTEEKKQGAFDRYTAYIIELEIDTLITKIFLRFSQALSIEQYVCKKHSNLQIPKLKNKQWLNKNNPKLIEQRKFQIERQLQVIFNSKEIRQNPKRILNLISKSILFLIPLFLDLPDNFFELPYLQKKAQINQLDDLQNEGRNETYAEILESVFNRKEIDIDKKIQQTKIQISSISSLLQKDQEIQNSRRQSIKRTQESQVEIDNNKLDLMIKVKFLDGNEINIGIEKTTIVNEIIKCIAKHLKLKSYLDFKLYFLLIFILFRLFIIESDNEYCSLLDDEEPIGQQLYNQMKGFNAIKNLFTSQQLIIYQQILSRQPYLFKKYIFLPIELENNDYQEDYTRLKLLVFQILDDIQTSKYYLSFNDYCLFASFYLYYKCEDSQQLVINRDIMKRIKPETVIPYKIYKTNTEKIWYMNILSILQSLAEQIRVLNQSKSQSGFDEKLLDSQYSKHFISKFLLMNSIKTKNTFGMNLYILQCPKETITQFLKLNQIQLDRRIYIGLNYQNLNLLTYVKKDLIVSYEYNQLANLEVNSSEIVLSFDQNLLKFKTKQGYEIKTIIQEFKRLKQFL